MKLTNAMEHTVRRDLARIQENFAGDDSACWCPLCRADMIALSLSSLVPRYWTKRTTNADADAAQASLQEKVSRAVQHVKRHPKHPRGERVSPSEPVWVVNFPLEESFPLVDPLVRSHEKACDCWKCRCDIVAFALNRYPSKYGVEYQGQTHLLKEDRDRMRNDLSSFLRLAVHVVAEVPHH